jgi:hypothetical protein
LTVSVPARKEQQGSFDPVSGERVMGKRFNGGINQSLDAVLIATIPIGNWAVGCIGPITQCLNFMHDEHAKTS